MSVVVVAHILKEKVAMLAALTCGGRKNRKKENFFYFFIFYLKKSVLDCLPCPLPCPRVRKNIKILDTSFGVSDTDFRESVACPCPTRDTPVQWRVRVFQDSTQILVRKFWSPVNLSVEINVIMQQTPKLQLPSTTSTTLNSILSQDYNRSKDPLVEGCVKQRCERGYSKLSYLIYNDRSFVNFELS